jgi:protein CpxP
MKKLGRIQTFAVAGLSALALATPLALAQTAGTAQGEQGQHRGEHGKRHGKRHGKGGEFGGHRRGGGMMFRGLDLTDEQKTRLKQLRQGFGERTKSLREQLHAKRQELRQAESGGTFNEALATQKLTETAGLQAKLMAEQFRMRQESLSILTAEQKAQLEQRRQQHEQRRGQRKAQRDAQPTQLQ